VVFFWGDGVKPIYELNLVIICREDMFATGASERKWTMFQDQFSSQRVPEMKHFVCHSSVGPLIAALMASKSATFFYDHVICKTPTNSKRGASIPWHQDLPYWNINGKMIGSVWSEGQQNTNSVAAAPN